MKSKYDLNFHQQIIANEEFRDAVKNSDKKLVLQLLTAKKSILPDIHDDNDYALKISAYFNNVEMMKILLTSPEIPEHANIHGTNNHILRSTIERGKLNAVKYLMEGAGLKEHASPDTAYPLVVAMMTDQLDIAKYLIKFYDKEKLLDNINYYIKKVNQINETVVFVQKFYNNLLEKAQLEQTATTNNKNKIKVL